MSERRVILIVLDSVGIGYLPDAHLYGDEFSDTIGHLYQNVEGFRLPNLEKMGLGNIRGVSFDAKEASPCACYGKMAEASRGKDTTTGHWEIAGLRLTEPFNVFPDGFPPKILKEFTERTGYGVLCNLPYSGTEVIKDYGMQHLSTGKLIVYTSADSVFQIAAHEEKVPLEELYRVCTEARKILDPYQVGRVIARPFIGTDPTTFKRTPNRRDFSMLPSSDTMLDHIKDMGLTVAAVGKIEDIFAGKGVTKAVHTVSNSDGIDKTLDYMRQVDDGIIFTNLVDFDMLYGHRNDKEGYANALREFDSRLPEITSLMRSEDILMITADHGCDPCMIESTDHSREYVPIIAYKRDGKHTDLGIRDTYSDIAATVCEYLGTEKPMYGTSFLSDII